VAEDKDSKTEEPTSKRLGKARNEGDVPQSQEVKSFAMLLAGLIVIGTMAPSVASQLAEFLTTFLERPHTIFLEVDNMASFVVNVALNVAVILALPIATFAFASVVSGVAINGFL